MNELSVTRYSFFHGPNQTERYAEYAPPKTDCDHPICNCTKHVTKRPDGEPSQITQYVDLTDQDQRIEFGLTNGWLTFRWDIQPGDNDKYVCKLNDDRKDNHAYFIFNSKQRSVRIEITMPGVGNVDCFFAHLYMGNKINISTLMNGHSPSNIINLSEIPDDAIWIHECLWGNEEMHFLHYEANNWRNAIIKMERLFELMAKYQVECPADNEIHGQTLHLSVAEILADIKKDPEIVIVANQIISHCRSVLDGIKESDLFCIQQTMERNLTALLNGGAN